MSGRRGWFCRLRLPVPVPLGANNGRAGSKNSQTTPATTSTTSIRQLLGAADTQTAHPATFNTAPTHQTTGLRERGNNTSKSTRRIGRQKAATRCNMRREERGTVQGPVKEQQPEGMSHRGRGGSGGGPGSHSAGRSAARWCRPAFGRAAVPKRAVQKGWSPVPRSTSKFLFGGVAIAAVRPGAQGPEPYRRPPCAGTTNHPFLSARTGRGSDRYTAPLSVECQRVGRGLQNSHRTGTSA